MNTDVITQVVDVQVVSTAANIPALEDFEVWVSTTLETLRVHAQLCIRLVDEPEMSELNESYRGQQGPTNVLSFPFDATEHTDPPLLGDIVICVPVVALEAKNQHKAASEHYAHMAVHGTLHLLGYDHETEVQAQAMEPLEIRILTELGFNDPYAQESV